MVLDVLHKTSSLDMWTSAFGGPICMGHSRCTIQFYTLPQTHLHIAPLCINEAGSSRPVIKPLGQGSNKMAPEQLFYANVAVAQTCSVMDSWLSGQRLCRVPHGCLFLLCCFSPVLSLLLNRREINKPTL